MSRGAKIVVAVCAGIVGVTMIAGLLFVAVIAGAGRILAARSTPEHVAEVGSHIADYDVPEGYVEEYAAEVAGLAVVAYRPEGRRGHLIVAQVPSWVDADRVDIARQMRRAVDDENSATDVRVEEVREVELRGEPTTVTVSLGRGSDGFEFKQLFGVFEGRDGTACVLAIDEVDSYDQAVLDGFLASIE